MRYFALFVLSIFCSIGVSKHAAVAHADLQGSISLAGDGGESGGGNECHRA